jgi:hypothetical protein
MAPRLKVFVTSDGLTDFVVAATSRAKALAAWGVRQDVFKEGQARETDDPELVAEATARPGEVLRRPAASRGELAKLKVPPKPAKAKAAAKPDPRPAGAAARPKLELVKPPPKAKGPSKAALKKVADLEAGIAALDAEHQQTLDRLARERAELERRDEALQADHAARRGKLAAALSAARLALG